MKDVRVMLFTEDDEVSSQVRRVVRTVCARLNISVDEYKKELDTNRTFQRYGVNDTPVCKICIEHLPVTTIIGNTTSEKLEKQLSLVFSEYK